MYNGILSAIMKNNIRKFAGKKVLILNRDSAAVLSLAGMVKDLGCESETAATWQEAIALCAEAKKAEKPFNIVLLDASTVDGNACAVAQKLRALDRNIKLVFSPGRAGGLSLSEWQKSGFSVTLPHPVRLDELTRVLA